MRDGMNLIPGKLTAAMVRSYIDFDGHEHTIAGHLSSQARLQSEGVAALWHLLETKSFAYLADEVGMGKTRQAMGVIATQFLRTPDSRVAIICSGETLQTQWQSEWSAFLQGCYKLLDGRLLGAPDARQLEPLHMHENLHGFVQALRHDVTRIHLLRYSSFSRPLSLGDGNLDLVLKKYAKSVGMECAEELSEGEREIAARFTKRTDENWQQDLTHELAGSYCARVAALLTHGTVNDQHGQPRRPFDLVIFDEAQNLRHIDNLRNKCIASIFRGNAGRWLFMSATPLHAGEHDIRSLDHYLCRRLRLAPAGTGAFERPYPHECGRCEHAGQCSRATWQLEGKTDVRTILQQIMVRRTRTYADSDGTDYGKIKYRHYEPVRYSGAEDPFYALTMALAQKRLAWVLAGKNNRFRQGECASFESLSASVGRHQLRPAEPVRDFEPKMDGKRPEEPGVAVDRTVIDQLNYSFRAAMSAPAQAMLPHAKLNNAVAMLFERSLKGASVDKTLVFVRRIDSVGEIRDLLRARFQQEIDARIETWRALLGRNDFARLREPVWGLDGFWESRADDADAAPVENSEDNESPSAKAWEGSSFRDPASLKYFDALRRVPSQNAGGGAADQTAKPGKLVSFRGRLLNTKDPSDNPLRGFLLKRHEADDAESNPTRKRIWKENQRRWLAFLETILGQARVAVLRAAPAQKFLFADTRLDTDDAWKLGALQRCLLESIRHSDLIVDLYILNSHVASTPDDDMDLPEKLLWLLSDAGDWGVPELAGYVVNWKERFRRWIEHFDLIVDKCFRGGTAAGWKEICTERVNAAFLGMAPVVGRSGDIENKYAVAQFNFPVHPNVLVCTDVLKEGVDMHLFCDQIMHYGVAWTSGDLEQRIGRIDRLGSLIGRRIERHPQDGTSELPRLGVKFPYLDGTLDHYQVERVIREKCISDLRMDLGKRKEEIGNLDAGLLDLLASLQVLPDAAPVVLFPNSAIFTRGGDEGIAWPKTIPYKQAGQHVRPWQAGAEAEDSETDLPVFACTRVLRRIEHGAKLLRLSRAPGEPAATRLTEEILVPAGGDATAAVAHILREAGPTGLCDSQDGRFGLCVAVNTLIWQPEVPVPFGGVTRRVLLETIGGAVWLLRVGVCASAKAEKNPGQKIALWNRERRWGYLADEDGQVWFCVMVQAAGGAVWDLLARLAEHAVRAARFHRNMLVPGGGEWDEPAYRSPRAFPSAGLLRGSSKNISAAYLSAVMARQGISSMKHEDLLLCGQLLSGVRVWFNEIFEAVLEAAYANEDQALERGLTIVPLEYLDGGLLHLSTQGKERFRLQAYLDLGDVLQGENIFSGPKMLWELAVSPHSHGPRPELPLSKLDAFPHVSDSGREGETSGQCGVFTNLDENGYRFIVVYHTPQAWESESGRLLAAWRAVRAKMQGMNNFQKKYCRDEFHNILGEPLGAV